MNGYINLAVLLIVFQRYLDERGGVLWPPAPLHKGRHMKVHEIFVSVQGEGVRSGQPTLFIRLAGCNLHCEWCDTDYARDAEEGKEMTVDDVLAEVGAHDIHEVCVTGGEPLVQEEAIDLISRLSHDGYSISVETNGSLPIDGLLGLERADRDGPRIMISMDVKCPSSGMDQRNLFENLTRLRTSDQLKFVIKDEEDLAFARDVLDRYPVECHVVIQPVWGTDPAWLVKRVMEEGLTKYGVRVMVQLHKVIWGERRGV
jgi:7-carboxy-7-deazaguanine synthase